jgi:outer membrane protein
VEGAMASNAAIAARQAAVESARAAVDAARADHYPQIALNLQRNQSNQDIDNSPRRNFTVDSISIEMRLSIYEGGRVNAATASALSQLAIANEQMDASRREVERDVRILYASATANRARIDSTNGEVDALNYTVRAQERGYELGVVTVIQVLDARRRLLRSRVDQSKARYDYLRDLIGLRMRAGSLSESDVIEFNRWLAPRGESVSRTDWMDELPRR